MESTGSYSLLAATVLYEAGHAVSVLNPRWIKDHARSDGRRNKTDTLDAEMYPSEPAPIDTLMRRF